MAFGVRLVDGPGCAGTKRPSHDVRACVREGRATALYLKNILRFPWFTLVGAGIRIINLVRRTLADRVVADEIERGFVE